jgi:hypothetical protein
VEAKIRTLLQENGVGFKVNSKSFVLSCPRCKKQQKLYIRKTDGRFCCFVCKETDNFQGQAEWALTELCGLSVDQVRTELYGQNTTRPTAIYLDLGIIDFEEENSEDFIDIEPSLTPISWPSDFLDLTVKESMRGAEYLSRRGIPLSIAVEYGIRYYPEKKSVVFPVLDNGLLYGYQTRLIENDKPYWHKRLQKTIYPLKAVTSKDFKKESTVMFKDRLRNSNHCILSEGPIDALKCHLAGGNVATLGKAVSSKQLQLVRDCGVERVYMGLDPDAYLEVSRIRKELSGLTIYDLRPPYGFRDLGEMSMEQVKTLFDSAQVLNPAQVVVFLKNHFGVN